MSKPEDQLKLPVECCKTGDFDLLPMGQAIDGLCQANFGIFAPSNRITWNVNGYRGWNNVYDIAGEHPMQFGLHVYERHGQPLTIDQAEALINGKKELSQNLFTAWASRFNAGFQKGCKGDPLPKPFWPFRHTKVLAHGSSSLMRPAYQMREDCTSFVVMGADRDSVDALAPNWTFFWKEFLSRWSK
jgi:hypothetical protein